MKAEDALSRWKMCFHRHIWQRPLEIWLTEQANVHVFWEMEWKQKKSSLLKAKLIFRTEWINDTLSQSQTRANIFTRADIFPKNKSKKIKINPNWKRKLIFRSFFNVHTSAVNCWSELLMSCCFIHDFFAAAFSLSSNLNVCPRSLMTLTTFLWIFCVFFVSTTRRQDRKCIFWQNRRSLRHTKPEFDASCRNPTQVKDKRRRVMRQKREN